MNYNTWKIFLLWWWSIKNWETNFIEKVILASVNKKEINILMINYANSIKDDTIYLDKFKKAYSKYNDYNVSLEQLNFSDSFKNDIKNKKIEKADVIYFWWWDTLKLKKSLLKNNLFEDIINWYLYNNKIIVWRSAWSLIFFEKFLSERWISNNEIWLFRWFNIFKWICSVHLSEYNEWPILEKFVLQNNINWLWMDECTCLIIENGQFTTLIKENKKIYKYLYRDKNIVISSIFSESFIDTNYLYY